MHETLEQIAKTCHEVNRAYCASMGDHSHRPWAAAPECHKYSLRQGVQKILTNPLTTPEEQHVSWLAQKAADGWRYGPVKDEASKEHPCMVPYGDLPAAQQLKDRLFGAVVRSFIPLSLGVDAVGATRVGA